MINNILSTDDFVNSLQLTFFLASSPLSKYAFFLHPSQRDGFPYFSSADLHLGLSES